MGMMKMINSVKMIGYSNHSFNYLQEYSRNKQVQKLVKRLEEGIEFKPGINIIVGENGCGKTTLLNIIRRSNLLEHSFIPKSNHFRVTNLEQMDELYDCFEIKQDLRLPVFNLYRMADDSEKIAKNDLDSSLEVKQFLGMKEESRGQNLKGDMAQLFHIMFERQSECYPMMKYLKESAERFPTPEKKEEKKEGSINIPVPDGPAIMRKVMENHVDSERPTYTILMDEPDQGLDIENLKDIYNTVSYNKEDTQLIAVIHNPFLIYKLMKLDYVNFIEMSEGYLKKVKEFLDEA